MDKSWPHCGRVVGRATAIDAAASAYGTRASSVHENQGGFEYCTMMRGHAGD